MHLILILFPFVGASSSVLAPEKPPKEARVEEPVKPVSKLPTNLSDFFVVKVKNAVRGEAQNPINGIINVRIGSIEMDISRDTGEDGMLLVRVKAGRVLTQMCHNANAIVCPTGAMWLSGQQPGEQVANSCLIRPSPWGYLGFIDLDVSDFSKDDEELQDSKILLFDGRQGGRSRSENLWKVFDEMHGTAAWRNDPSKSSEACEFIKIKGKISPKSGVMSRYVHSPANLEILFAAKIERQAYGADRDFFALCLGCETQTVFWPLMQDEKNRIDIKLAGDQSESSATIGIFRSSPTDIQVVSKDSEEPLVSEACFIALNGNIEEIKKMSTVKRLLTTVRRVSYLKGQTCQFRANLQTPYLGYVAVGREMFVVFDLKRANLQSDPAANAERTIYTAFRTYTKGDWDTKSGVEVYDQALEKRTVRITEKPDKDIAINYKHRYDLAEKNIIVGDQKPFVHSIREIQPAVMPGSWEEDGQVGNRVTVTAGESATEEAQGPKPRDVFSKDDVSGLFSTTHLLVLFVAIIVAVGGWYMFKNQSEQKSLKTHKLRKDLKDDA